MTINFDSVKEARAQFSSSTESYTLSADINVNAQKAVTAINNGVVKKADVQVATFSSWQEGQLSINFETTEEMQQVAEAAKEFCSSAREQIPEMEIKF